MAGARTPSRRSWMRLHAVDGGEKATGAGVGQRVTDDGVGDSQTARRVDFEVRSTGAFHCPDGILNDILHPFCAVQNFEHQAELDGPEAE